LFYGGGDDQPNPSFSGVPAASNNTSSTSNNLSGQNNQN
jgi:hypothetical protein